MTTKRIGKSALKRMFKSQELCYSIGEAGRRFLRKLTSIFSTGANGRNISHKHGFKNGWRDISKEELSANMYCIREINLIGMRFLCLPIELICGWQSKARCNTGCAVLNSDQEIPALLLNVSKIVIGFIASVRKEQSTFNSRAIYHGS